MDAVLSRVVEIWRSVDELLRSAITHRKHIRFCYDGKERIAEPHDYGIQNGKLRLLAYQIAGESRSGALPNWRLIDVSGITRLEILERTFPGNRPAPAGRRHAWERLFIRVGGESKPPDKS